MDTYQTKSKRNIIVIVAMLAGGILVGAGMLLGCGAAGYLVGIGMGSRTSVDGAPPVQPSGPMVGTAAPDFELVSLSGETIRLSDYRGMPVLLNFWASWCGPCVSEMGLIQAQQDAFSAELVILAVDVDDSEATARSFAQDHNLTFTILMDSDGTVQSEYRTNAIPVSYFIDVDGVIQAVHLGVIGEEQMERYLLLLGVEE